MGNTFGVATLASRLTLKLTRCLGYLTPNHKSCEMGVHPEGIHPEGHPALFCSRRLQSAHSEECGYKTSPLLVPLSTLDAVS